MALHETRPMIDGDFRDKNVISIDQFTRGDIEQVVGLAEMMQLARGARDVPQLLSGMVFKAVMFEDSSRTAGSFLSAAGYLGAVPMQPNLDTSSRNKGESDIETVRCFAGQADGLLLRHRDPDFMDRVAARIDTPFQNGGNGRSDHPSQTLLDLYTFRERYQTLDGLRVVIFGDVANNRPARSLLRGLSKFDDNEIIIAAPAYDPMPDDVIAQARVEADRNGTTIRQVTDLRPLIGQAGIFYGSRPRKEYGDAAAAERMAWAYEQNGYNVSHESWAAAHPKAYVTHALPHTSEIADDFHTDPRAFYFDMEDNGTAVRMALLGLQHAQSELQWQDWGAVRELQAAAA